MTTSDPLESLRNLTSHKAATEAEHDRNRSKDRSPVTAATAYVASIVPHSQVNRFGDNKTGILLTLDNLQSIKVATGADPIQPGTSRSIFIPVPDKPNLNSEVAQMAGSAAAVNDTVDSILDLLHRTITFNERVHTFTGRKNTGATDGEGKPVWADATFNVYYYHVTKIVGSAQQAEAVLQPTPETMAAVTKYVVDVVAAGGEFSNISAVVSDLKSLGVDLQDKANAAIQSAIVGGKLKDYVGIKEAVVA